MKLIFNGVNNYNNDNFLIVNKLHFIDNWIDGKYIKFYNKIMKIKYISVDVHLMTKNYKKVVH